MEIVQNKKQQQQTSLARVHSYIYVPKKKVSKSKCSELLPQYTHKLAFDFTMQYTEKVDKIKIKPTHSRINTYQRRKKKRKSH